MVQFLLSQGVGFWLACENTKSIDAFVLISVVDDIMAKLGLDDKTQERIRRFVATGPTTEQLCLFLGTTKEDFEKEHERKLAQVVTLLPQAYA